MFAPPPGAAFSQSKQVPPPPYTFNQQQYHAPFTPAQKPKLEPQYNEFGTICNLFNPYNIDPKAMNSYENPRRPYANPSQYQQQLHLQEMQRQYQQHQRMKQQQAMQQQAMQQQEMQRQHMLYLQQQQGMYQQQQPASYGRMPTY